jgi:hypothetical protein
MELRSVDTKVDIQIDAKNDQLSLDGPNLFGGHCLVGDPLHVIQKVKALVNKEGQLSQSAADGSLFGEAVYHVLVVKHVGVVSVFVNSHRMGP